MNYQILIAFGIYFCILLAIGLFFYFKSKTESNFILGNRSVNYWVTAISAQSSDMGSWLFLAFPAAIYSKGLIELWTAIGLVVFMFLNWQFIAPRLRTQTEQYKSLTLTSYFNNKYGSAGLIGLISALITVLFFTFYIASGLVGLGRLFESAFGLDYYTGIVLGLLSAIIYILIGGYVAVAWCNLFQGLFLLAAIVIVPVYALFKLGSVQTIIDAAHAKNVSLSLLPEGASIWTILFLAAGWGLGYFGQPHILVNFMGIDDVKKIRFAKYIGITWQIIVLAAAAAIGLIALPFFISTPLPNPELLFVLMTKSLFFPLLAGFILCGILAATLSSMNTQILIAGTVIAEDIYKKIFNRQASSHMVVWVSRVVVVAVSISALFIARNNSNTVYDLVNYAWSGLGSAFGPLVLLSLYSDKVTKQGALCGILTGALVSALWPYLNTGILPMVPGFTSSFIAIVTVSFLSKK